jgi:hypothetical protein
MNEPRRPLRRARLLSAALLAVVFVAGVLVGAATDRAIGSSREHKPRRHGIDAEVLERMHLDARQQTEVDQILEHRRTEAAAVWSEVKPRLNQIVAGTRTDLSRVLTPGQLREYDLWIAERARRMEKHFQSESNSDHNSDRNKRGK